MEGQTQRALMELLAANGNYAAALVAYRELRVRLHRETNCEPDPETQALFDRLRAEAREKAGTRSTRAAPARMAESRNARQRHSEGTSLELTSGRLRQGAHLGPVAGACTSVHSNGIGTHPLEVLLPKAGPNAASPLHLPLQLTTFIGRETEIAAIREQLTSHRLVTLTGAGGSGKTRLALEIASGLLPSYPDGVWFVRLAPLADPALVPQTVAAALGIREPPDSPVIERLLEALKPRQALLLLDNCEHLVEACAQLAEMVLQACPHLRLLATSRELLGIAGEQPYRVPSLTLPPALGPGGRGSGVGPDRPKPDTQHQTPAALLEYEAVRLFVERAATAQPAFSLTAENATAVAQVCRRLDGIPLAIELAAARLKALPVEQLNQRLNDMLGLLTGGSRTVLPRHQTLRALIDWSYDLLSEAEQTLLRRLSVFAGGCTLEAAEAVCSDHGFWVLDFGLGPEPSATQNPKPKIQNMEALDLLTRLVEKSQVVYEEREGEGRYRLLEMIREYAQERLEASGEKEGLRERHAQYFLALSEAAGPQLTGPDQRGWLDRLDQDLDNLRAALAWSMESDEVELGLRLASALGGFWCPRGHVREGRAQLSRLLAHPAAGARTAVRARALTTAGELAWFQADLQSAKGSFEESLAIYRARQDRQGIATVLLHLGNVALSQWDWPTAQTMAEESLAIRRELGDRREIADALTLLAEVLRNGIDLPAARTLFEDILAIWRELDDRPRIVWGLNNVACAAMDLGDLDTAGAAFEESLTRAHELGDRLAIAWALDGLGQVAWMREEFPVARAYFEQNLVLWRELDSKEGLVQSLGALGHTRRPEGDSAAAYDLFREMLAVAREENRSNYVARSLVYLGATAADLGWWEEAAVCCAEGLRLSRSGETIGDRAHIAWGLTGLARVELAAGRPTQAARLLAATEAWWNYCNIPWWRRELDRAASAVRAQMEAAEFEATWNAGQAAPLDQIIAEALEEAPAG